MTKGGMIVKWILLGVLLITLFGVVTMYLWNWLVPELFNGPHITFFQALGLVVLSKILFSGFGGKHGHCNQCNHQGGAQPYWKNRFYEKFSNMNPEEREAFKSKMREKWCNWENKEEPKKTEE